MFDRRIAVLLIVALLVPAAWASDIDPSAIDPNAINATGFAELNSDDQIHPEIVKAQILLDRTNISPGEINGQRSGNFDQALRAFAQARGLSADPAWSTELWTKLTSTVTGPVLTEYVVTKEDAKGPFIQLPARMEDMKGLKALGYSGLREALAEKFHMSESLLTTLNPDASFARAGEKIMVANVITDQKPTPVARVDIDKDRQTIKAYSSNGELVAFFPASVGSEEKPSPSGTLKVMLIESGPSYHYNPKYHFKEVDTQKPFDLNPGPNNPLGSTWIALSQPSYGIHGTPEPALVGKSESHGCVRVTNWDAQRLAGMLTKGIPVHFIEKWRDEPDFQFAAY
jgi:lipoprotein-anchoring transpeptidase ErfK/SrfK